MALDEYKKKRNFEKTPEPSAEEAREDSGQSFVVQKHAARRLHYDFRLELDGVLLSWAVPKGPSLDPSVKRLAMQTEDHPVAYGGFEGVIPKQQYGGGAVQVWDRGTWKGLEDPHKGLEKGHLSFELYGEKLQGAWHLVRTKGRNKREKEKGWLLIKAKDDVAQPEAKGSIVENHPLSVLSGRTLEEIAEQADRVWHSDSDEQPAALPDPSTLHGAKEAPLPKGLEPQLATLVSNAPSGQQWLHEIKYDGYRLLIRIDNGKPTFLTRRGKEWTHRFPALAGAIESWGLPSALLDAEVVALGNNGVSDFQALQNSLSEGKDTRLVLFVFDLVYLIGFDLRASSLDDRKHLLKELLESVGSEGNAVRFSDHVLGKGPAFYERACQVGLEGIVSKRAAGRYLEGRSRDWLKVKCVARQEFVVGGFTKPRGSRSEFGALLLGVYENGSLRYVGKVGTGFTQQSLKQIAKQLEPHRTNKPPFHNPPRGAAARDVQWLRPRMVAEVELTGFTDDGNVRHPSFKGLREDKEPEEVHPEVPKDWTEQTDARKSRAGNANATLHGVRLSHPERVLYGEQGITKGDLAQYYAQVAEWMLPHIANRPLTLLRCPSGEHKECFYQKHAKPGLPSGIKSIHLSGQKSEEAFVAVDDLEGLLGLVQLGVLEVHTWGSRSDRPERPDQLIFDLDPDPDLPWTAVVEAAHTVRERLKELGLQSWAKTTGGKGLHVVLPITRRSSWEEAKAFCKAVAEDITRAHPKRYLATMSKAKRKGKIFIDYLRNGYGASAIATYSTRARHNAPVSVPLRWDELDANLHSDHFTVQSLPRRLRSLRKDPWEGYFDATQSITASMRKELSME